jgi:hypothetical protein
VPSVLERDIKSELAHRRKDFSLPIGFTDESPHTGRWRAAGTRR